MLKVWFWLLIIARESQRPFQLPGGQELVATLLPSFPPALCPVQLCSVSWKTSVTTACDSGSPSKRLGHFLPPLWSLGTCPIVKQLKVAMYPSTFIYYFFKFIIWLKDCILMNHQLGVAWSVLSRMPCGKIRRHWKLWVITEQLAVPLYPVSWQWCCVFTV